jgi:hypothetical protein
MSQVFLLLFLQKKKILSEVFGLARAYGAPPPDPGGTPPWSFLKR